LTTSDERTPASIKIGNKVEGIGVDGAGVG